MYYVYIYIYIYILLESGGEEIWNESGAEADDEDFIDVHNEDVSNPPPAMPVFSLESEKHQSAQSLLQWIVGFIFVLQAKHHMPNSALDLLIKFIYALLCVLSSFSPFIDTLRRSFPPSLYLLRKHFMEDCSFSKYPVCPKCNKVYYSYNNCIEVIGSQKVSRHCNFFAFPNHPHQSRRTACGALLMKTVHFTSGRKVLYPYKVYCYNGIRSTLQKLLLRPNFHVACEVWKQKQMASNVIADIYDGCIWKEFTSFLEAPYALGLILNFDFFQPYTHTTYSVGVFYLTIMNLPCTLRYRILSSLE